MEIKGSKVPGQVEAWLRGRGAVWEDGWTHTDRCSSGVPYGFLERWIQFGYKVYFEPAAGTNTVDIYDEEETRPQ